MIFFFFFSSGGGAWPRRGVSSEEDQKEAPKSSVLSWLIRLILLLEYIYFVGGGAGCPVKWKRLHWNVPFCQSWLAVAQAVFITYMYAYVSLYTQDMRTHTHTCTLFLCVSRTRDSLTWLRAPWQTTVQQTEKCCNKLQHISSDGLKWMWVHASHAAAHAEETQGSGGRGSGV